MSDLSDLPNLRAAPIYICIDMYDDGSCGAKAKAAIAEVVEHRGSGAAAAALGAGAAAADAASGAAGAQQGYGGGGAPPRQQSLVRPGPEDFPHTLCTFPYRKQVYGTRCIAAGTNKSGTACRHDGPSH